MGCIHSAPAKEMSVEEVVADHIREGRLWVNIRERGTAIARFDAALRLDPNNITAHVYKAEQLRILCRFQEAVDELEKVMKLAPTQRAADRVNEAKELLAQQLAQQQEAELAFQEKQVERDRRLIKLQLSKLKLENERQEMKMLQENGLMYTIDDSAHAAVDQSPQPPDYKDIVAKASVDGVDLVCG